MLRWISPLRRLPVAVFTVSLLALPALLAACDSDTNDGTVSSIEQVRSDAPRNSIDASAGDQTATAINAFATDLYRVLADNDDNAVFSPYSIAIALAMTRAGAEGETAEQMDEVLHAALAGDLHAGFNTLSQALAERSGEYEVTDGALELDLRIVNQLFGQQGFEFVEDFLDRLAANYGADMRLVDYAEAHEDARQLINEWVAEQTNDRIAELIPDGVIDDMTRLVLTNAIYLNAPWSVPFDADGTEPNDFTRLDGSTVEADMMRRDARANYGTGDGYQAVQLPYVDGSLSMVAILPDEGEFEAFEAGLDADKLDEVLRSLGDANVNLRFPQFEFRTEALLKDALSELGMPIAFDRERADFTGMFPEPRGYLQDVVHEAFISVDEEGTEAAAATGVVVGEVSAPPLNVDLAFDRPFVFVIHDRETGAILFMGRVLDPTA